MLVLVAEADAITRRMMARELRAFGHPILASNAKEAIGLIQTLEQIDAAIVSLDLDEGSGFDVINALRTAAVLVPVLVVLKEASDEALRRCQLLGAQVIPRPIEQENIAAFVKWVKALRSGTSLALYRIIEEYAGECGLSPRETELVRLAATGTPLAELAGTLQISQNTVKTLIRRVLQKTGADRLSTVVRVLHSRLFD